MAQALPINASEKKFDYGELQKEFSKHCKDYGKKLKENEDSLAVSFCREVVFKIGPEASKDKRSSAEKEWSFSFVNQDGNHVITIRSFKNTKFIPRNEEKSMLLTVNNAGLLAQDTFAQMARLDWKNKEILLTPLAKSCFNVDDIKEGKFAKTLGMSIVDLIVAINQSCQPAGHHLPHSNANIAIVAYEHALRNMKDPREKEKNVKSFQMQYIKCKKIPDVAKLEVVRSFANGGLPAELKYLTGSTGLNQQMSNLYVHQRPSYGVPFVPSMQFHPQSAPPPIQPSMQQGSQLGKKDRRAPRVPKPPNKQPTVAEGLGKNLWYLIFKNSSKLDSNYFELFLLQLVQQQFHGLWLR